MRAGEVRIESAGATTRIVQQGQRGIIDWPSFSIGAGQRFEYSLPASSAISLNRVTGSTAARIDGELASNGQVWLISPAGVLIGPSGSISTHGFLASTLEIADQAFLQGQHRLVAGSGTGRIDHQGLIRSLDGGYAIIAGASVRSSGVIEARLGEVVIASARTLTLDLTGDRLLSFAVDGAVLPAASGDPAIDIPGRISAEGGRVSLSARAATDIVRGVINVSGLVEAGRAIERNGEIVLEAGPAGSAHIDGQVATTGRFEKRGDGALALTGTLDVNGQLALTEGRIELLPGGRLGSMATEIALAAGTTLDLSTPLAAGERLVLGPPSGDGAIALGSNRLDLYVEGRNSSFAGTIAGDGAQLYKYGDGMLTLTGRSTYSGGTWVVDGRIRLGGANRSARPGTPGPVGTGLVYADVSNDAQRAWERAIARELAQAAERARLAAEALAAQKPVDPGPTILQEQAVEAISASRSVSQQIVIAQPAALPPPVAAPPPPPVAAAPSAPAPSASPAAPAPASGPSSGGGSGSTSAAPASSAPASGPGSGSGGAALAATATGPAPTTSSPAAATAAPSPAPGPAQASPAAAPAAAPATGGPAASAAAPAPVAAPPVVAPPPSPVPAEKPPTPRDAADSGDMTLQAAAPPPPPKPASQPVRASVQTVAVSPGLVSTQIPVPPRPPAGAALDQRLPGTGNSARW
jgi:filamentous hemagglutinin family protein